MSKYTMNADLRGERIQELTLNAPMEVIKSFFLLQENGVMRSVPKLVGPKLAVNKIISIPPEAIKVLTNKGETITVTAPECQIGLVPLPCRLLSSKARVGMTCVDHKQDTLPKSTGLIFHIHGGGFVACNSKLHELYLRQWAVSLNAPIFSVDYTLSPEAIYPRQVEECFFAYCWALENCGLLGTTAEKIAIVGDSAGGTFTMALAMKCLEAGVRLPDGILVCYGLLRLQPMNPSRYLGLIDPIVPFGLLRKCVDCYLGEEHQTCYDDGRVPDASLSPMFQQDEKLSQLPPTSFITTDMDPCLDDCVEFAKRLRNIGKPPYLKVLPGLPHGFLFFQSL